MKVLHINTTQDGGAAWCAMRINNALVQQGVESRMLFANGDALPEGIKGGVAKKDNNFWYSNALLGKLKHLLMRLPWYTDGEKMELEIEEYNNTVYNPLFLNHPFSYFTNISSHPLIEWADVIHLHFVSNFIDYPTFFRRIKKPIVWTLHDMYPLLGVMHYESEFSKLPQELIAINNKCLKVKRDSLKYKRNLHFVAISEMMIKRSRESEITRDFDCSLIHNGVDTELFNYHDRKFSKKSFLVRNGLDESSTVFMFSSYEIWDDRKGLMRVIEALKKCNCMNKVLVVVGMNGTVIEPNENFPIICTGLITNQAKLADLYSSVDYFISASYEETFGQTITEAMSCGTPVISTPTGVAPDIISPFNGILCCGFKVNDIVCGINDALNHCYNSEQIRQHVVDYYNYPNIAREYIELYSRMLKE